MAWVPTTDFEEEIVELEPYHDFIYGHLSEPSAQTFYPRPKEHLDFVQQQKKTKNVQEKNLTSSQNHKLNLIAKIQQIAGTKPLGEQPTLEDWDSNENIVRETIALMRHVGFNPSVEEALDEGRTIATHPITEDVKINRNGRKHMPIFFGDKFFELKPRGTTTSPTYAANNRTEMGAENDVERLNESFGSQRSSSTSNGSNSASQASSNGTQSRNSMSDICKAVGFNYNENYNTLQTDATTKSPKSSKYGRPTQAPRNKQTGRTTQSPSNKLIGRATQSPRTSQSGRVQIDRTLYLGDRSLESPKRAHATRRGSSSHSNSSSGSNISRANSSVLSPDTYKDRSSNTGNSGFESAIDEVFDDDSFETAQNSLHENDTQMWRKNKSTKDNGKNIDKVVMTQSWRNSNITAGENNYHIQSNWRSPNDYRRKEQKSPKIKTELCTPKELYEKKRQCTQ
ncbi:uncharacterized protein squ [Eurosta solidaginis]|uniref:uncharacterized protein squ n=1 Tax=Eurosta solidaginis TaxID=178769 RepID=UPI0035314E5C